MRRQRGNEEASGMLRFVNARVLREGAVAEDDFWVDVRTGRVVDPMRRFYEARSSAELEAERRIDCRGGIVAPGYIDAQFNGGFGVDFSNVEQMRDRENVRKCCRELVRTGVTAFCPTLISCKPDEYREILACLDAFMDDPDEQDHGAEILGVHLEGPFFNRDKIGAHPLENILAPDAVEDVREVYKNELAHVRMVTLAPEQPGALELIRALRARGIVVSIGHSAAALDEADAGVAAGATMITHMFNAMGAFHHRDPGIVGLLGRHQVHERLSFGIICDGLHANPASVSIAYQSHPRGVVLVTDAMAGMGLPTGTHALGAQEVEITWAEQPRADPASSPAAGPRTKSKKAVLRGTETLAGSVVSMEECVQNFRAFTGCSDAEALEAASAHPARALNLPSSRGNIRFGSAADFVILEPETLRVVATFRRGRCLFMNEAFFGETAVSIAQPGSS